ncbi:MAG: hypothetical protein J4F49_01940 [Rhodobacteraceae bacterium]|nr:hypothetical protein [Paracoccaceae bacterium]
MHSGADLRIYPNFIHRQLNAVMLSDLIKLGISSIRSPRAAATQLLNIELNRVARYQFALLVVILSALSAELILGLGSADLGETDAPTRLWSPFGFAALEAGILAVIILATVLVGRASIGTGKLDDALLLIAWLRLIALNVQIAFALALSVGQALDLVGPHADATATFLIFAAMGYLIWMYANFVAALYSIDSPVKAFIKVILTVLATIAVVQWIILALVVMFLVVILIVSVTSGQVEMLSP